MVREKRILKVISAGNKKRTFEINKGIIYINGINHAYMQLPESFAGFEMSPARWRKVYDTLRWGWPHQTYNHLEFSELLK